MVGNANSRGEIACDPADPLSRARDLGARLFDIRVTDYRLTTVRSNKVWIRWGADPPHRPILNLRLARFLPRPGARTIEVSAGYGEGSGR